MSAIDVTKKILFERLYLVPGMGTFGPWVNCPYAPTTPTVHATKFLDYRAIFSPEWPLIFLVITIHQVIWLSPGTLPATGVSAGRRFAASRLLIRWPINRSNRFSDFWRLDRLDRFGKIIKSIFSKFWKREFQSFRISRISLDFWSFANNVFSCIYSKFPEDMSNVVVAYSLSSSNVERKILGSKPTIPCWNLRKLEYKEGVFWKILLLFTRTCTTYISFLM